MAKPPLVIGVDDSDTNLELLSEYLAGTGCEFVAVGDGETALLQIAEKQPDLVLLDVVMPGLDGFEVCRRIRAHRENRLLPVVLVTSRSSVEDRVQALEAGADDFLTNR